MPGGRKPKHAQQPPRPPTTLILDNGADTIKAGLLSSSSPRRIPNSIARDRARHVYVASEIDKCRDFGEIAFRRPVEKGFVVNWEVQKDIWERELFDDDAPLHVDPKDARLILAEAPNGLPVLQTNCDQIVFEEYGFASYFRGVGSAFNAYHDLQSLFRTPKDAATAAPAPAEICLVVDSGYSHTTITPVFRGQPIHAGIRRLDVGGKFLTNYLARLISMRHFDMRNDYYIVNEMKEAACFVSLDFKADLEKTWKGTRGEKRPEYATGGGIVKDYVLPDFHTKMKGVLRDYDPALHVKSKHQAPRLPHEDDVLTLRNERFAIPELLFNPSDCGLREPGIPDLIQQSLQSLPVGLWPGLLANIVVVGGNAYFDGFVQRLQREVVQRVPDDCVVRVARPPDPIACTWTGAANFAVHADVERAVVTKAQYEEHGAAWVAKKFASGWDI